jgi:hypothetical protein
MEALETLTMWIDYRKNVSFIVLHLLYYIYFLVLVLKNSVMLLFDFAMLSAWRR